MKLGYYSVLFYKRTPYGVAQKYVLFLIISTFISATVKLATVAFAICTFFREDLKISWYFVALAVILAETIIYLAIYKNLKKISTKQSIHYKNQQIYESFAGLHIRHVFVAQSRLFTSIFIIIMAIIIMIAALFFSNLGEVYAYLNNFSSIILIILIFFDSVYFVRHMALERRFKINFQLEINKLYWKQYKESFAGFSMNKDINYSEVKGNGAVSLKSNLTYSKLKKIRFFNLKDFETSLKKLGKKINGFENILYFCPHCNCDTKMFTRGDRLLCGHCGKQWKLQSKGVIEAVSGVTEFDVVYNWYNWQKVTTEKAVQNNTYGFSSRCYLEFLPFNDKPILLGEGTLLQEKTLFTFLSDDGIKVDFDTSRLDNISFKLNDGLYLNDGQFNYLIILLNKHDSLKVNFSLKAYQEIINQ